MTKPVLIETPLQRNSVQAVMVLREYLDMAERGEIEAVALVGLRPDGICSFRWSATQRFTAMAGGIAVLQHLLLNEYA